MYERTQDDSSNISSKTIVNFIIKYIFENYILFSFCKTVCLFYIHHAIINIYRMHIIKIKNNENELLNNCDVGKF